MGDPDHTAYPGNVICFTGIQWQCDPPHAIWLKSPKKNQIRAIWLTASE